MFETFSAKFKSNGSARIAAFRQFLFAPNLLTFVISVIVGNSFGSAIKDLITTISGIFKALTIWIFSSAHTLHLDYVSTPLEEFIDSMLTLLFIALVVFYTVQFINTYLVRSADEKWGYDQAHEDALRSRNYKRKTTRWLTKTYSCKKNC